MGVAHTDSQRNTGGRFPSRREFGALVLAVAAPLHFWAVLQFLYRLPALVLRLPLNEILALLAYILSAELAETLLLCGALTLLAALLPRNALRNPFLPTTVALVYLSILWMIAFYLLPQIVGGLAALLPTANYYGLLLGTLGTIMFSYAAFVLRLPHLVRMRPRWWRITDALVARLSVFSGMFLALDVISLVLVVFRNLF